MNPWYRYLRRIHDTVAAAAGGGAVDQPESRAAVVVVVGGNKPVARGGLHHHSTDTDSSAFLGTASFLAFGSRPLYVGTVLIFSFWIRICVQGCGSGVNF